MKKINEKPIDNIITISDIELDNSLEMHETLVDDLWLELLEEIMVLKHSLLEKIFS